MPSYKDYPEFRPNLTPKQIFSMGSFGGTYWRPIHSKVTNRDYKNQHRKYDWAKSIDDSLLTSPDYDKSKNLYGVKVGTSLRFWESKKWITKYDSYGWVQWYCNFHEGRRTPDDRRQIDRWLGLAGPNGRFRKWLIGMVRKRSKARTNKDKVNDHTISPAIRQTLQHWGYRLSVADYEAK